MTTFQQYLNERSNNDKLVSAFKSEIEKVDDSLDVKDFAKIIAEILNENYGKHNFETFVNTLESYLD